MKTIIYTIFTVSFFIACQTPNYYAGNHEKRNRLIVTFISKGEGIDNKAKEDFEKLISAFNTTKCEIGYEAEILYKEGEKVYYFPSGQSAKCLERFVIKAKALLKNKELVILKEYTN